LYRLGDYRAARPLFTEALAIFRVAGAKPLAAFQLKNLGYVAYLLGDFQQAALCFEESLTLYQEIGNKSNLGRVLSELGIALSHQGDHARATGLLTEASTVSQEISEPFTSALCLIGMAGIQQNPARSVTLLAAILAALKTSGETLQTIGPFYRTEYEHTLQAAQSTLSEVVFTSAWTAGSRMPLAQAITYAVSG
jgi:tetratricopeptide (TPR) repeat protein